MSARAEVPHQQRRSAGSHLLLRFLEMLPPYRWTRARLVQGGAGRFAVIAIPYVWLLLFFLIPFVIVLKIGFSETQIALPPYQPLFEYTQDKILQIKLNVGNFLYLVEDNLYWRAYLNSLKIAAISTLLCLLVGYPIAYAIARANTLWRNILLMMVILPFWTSFLLRVYAWIGILKNNGLINNFLMWLGVIDQPLVMLQTDFAIYVGIVYSYLPFMILPLYTSLEKMDLTLLEAAADLGSRPWKAFVTITLPLSTQGIIAGSLLVFIPAVGEFVIPALLGGPEQLMIGKVLWTEFFSNRDWPVASAVAVALLVLLLIPIALLQRAQAAEARAA
ncbi:MAG TPA: ABC transporter permease subunit [Steroidobacteraceae bacterium]|nr:ABC transporter permease subunit [Steroidobacteraceae bacterium]